MKHILTSFVAIAALAFSAIAADNPILRQALTTNTPTAMTNVVKSIPPVGVTYPTNWGAVSDGNISYAAGLGNPTVVGGTDDGPIFNTIFNSVPMGTVIDCGGLTNFINTPMFATNGNGQWITLKNANFCTTNLAITALTWRIDGFNLYNVQFVGPTNATTSIAIDSDSNLKAAGDYANTANIERVRTKGGWGTGLHVLHQNITKVVDCIFFNCRSNSVFVDFSDQVTFLNTFFGAPGGFNSLINDPVAGGNPNWLTNSTSVQIQDGIKTILINCANFGCGTFLYANHGKVNFLGGDYEQGFSPTNRLVGGVGFMWFTNCSEVLVYGVNLLNNAAGSSTNLTSYKLDNCNLTQSYIASSMLNSPSFSDAVEVFGKTSNGHNLPYVQGTMGPIRLHTAYGDTGRILDASNGNVASTMDANYFGDLNVFSNRVDFVSGVIGDLGFGADNAGRGTRTANIAKYASFGFPSYGGTGIDRYPMWWYSLFSAGNFLDILYIGGNPEGLPGANIVRFGLGSVNAIDLTTTSFAPQGWSGTLGTPAAPFVGTYTKASVIETNTFTGVAQVVALALPTSGCIICMSNATLMLVCTNRIDGNATVTRIGGL